MTILITGFSSFPGAPANPTADLVQSLASARLDDGEAWRTAVLPVQWERSWTVLAEAIDAVRPRAVLMLGLAVRSERIRIELVARSRRDAGLADAAGCFPPGPEAADPPGILPVKLPLAEIASALRSAAVEFEWSRDAGSYLCNDTLFRLAAQADGLGVLRFGFVHMPLSDELVPEWAAEDCLPERCRTLPAATLMRAATAIAGVL